MSAGRKGTFIRARDFSSLKCLNIGHLKPLIFRLSQMENSWCLSVPIVKDRTSLPGGGGSGSIAMLPVQIKV